MEEDGGGSDGDQGMVAKEGRGGWLVSCTLGIEVRDERPGAAGEVEKGQ